MERYEYTAGKASKFWAVAVEESTLILTWGKIGTKGERKEQVFASSDEAKRKRDHMSREKLRLGYRSVD